MAESKERENISKEVRSILLAEQRGMSCREFNREWKDLIGYPLPYRKMGFNSLEEYFKSIPEVVRLSWQDGELHLVAVSNEATQHIQRMVSCQKSSKKRSRPKRRPPQLSSSRRYVSPWFSQPAPPRFQPAPPRFQPAPRPSQPVVPPFLRGQIQQLTSQFPHGINGSTFGSAFQKKFGRELNPDFLGFCSIHDLLKAVPDIVNVERLPSGGYRVISKCGGPPSRIANQALQQSVNQRPSQPQEQRPCQQPPQQLPQQQSQPQSQPVREDFSKAQAAAPQRAQQRAVEERMQDTDLNEDNSGLPVEVKANIRQVLTRFPAGVRCLRFIQHYKSYVGEELDFSAYGYTNLVTLMSALPQIVAIERLSSNDWLFMDARSLPSSEQQKSTSPKSDTRKPNLHTAPVVPDEVKETIRQVVMSCSEGLALTDLVRQYEDLVGEKLDVAGLGFRSIGKLVDECSDVVTSENYILHLANPFAPFREDLLHRKLQKKRQRIPADAVGPGNAFTPQDLPEVNLEHFIDVLVSMVDTPSSFFLQLHGPKTAMALEDLMDELGNFYEGPSSDLYQIPDSLVQKGLACAAVFFEDGNWHRVALSDVSQPDFPKAYFVDYGGVYAVNRSSLRFLRTRYMKLPAQALRAKLACIEPIAEDKKWSKAANKYFLRVVNQRRLKASVDEIDQNGRMSVLLCDVSDPNHDVYVNDSLVDHGYAVSAQESSPEPTAAPPAESVFPRSVPSNENQEGELRPTNIQFVELTDQHSFHLLRINAQPWVISTEISHLFGRKDQILNMISRMSLHVDSMQLQYDHHQDLFDEFIDFQVAGTKDGDGKPKNTVTVFSLESVEKILRFFRHPSKELIEVVQDEIRDFDNEDPYWKGEEYSDDDDDDDNVSIGDYELAFNVLQKKRKRAIAGMSSDPLNCQKYVDDLEMIEKQMEAIKQRIKKLRQEFEAGRVKLSQDDKLNSPSKKSISLPSGSSASSQANVHAVAPMPNPAASPATPDLQQMMSQLSMTDSGNQQQQQQLLDYQRMLMSQLASVQTMINPGLGRGLGALQINPMIMPNLGNLPATSLGSLLAMNSDLSASLAAPGQNSLASITRQQSPGKLHKQ